MWIWGLSGVTHRHTCPHPLGARWRDRQRQQTPSRERSAGSGARLWPPGPHAGSAGAQCAAQSGPRKRGAASRWPSFASAHRGQVGGGARGSRGREADVGLGGRQDASWMTGPAQLSRPRRSGGCTREGHRPLRRQSGPAITLTWARTPPRMISGPACTSGFSSRSSGCSHAPSVKVGQSNSAQPPRGRARAVNDFVAPCVGGGCQ